MQFDINNFNDISYENGVRLFFDKSYSFHDHFGHKRNTSKFPFHKNILLFLNENPGLNIFFTLNEEIKSFIKIKDGFLINMISYCNFCKTIGSKTGGRAKAFLGQNLSINDVSFSEEKDEFIKVHASEKNIISAIRNFSPVVQDRISNVLNAKRSTNENDSVKENVSHEFNEAFLKLLHDPNAQSAFYDQIPKIQIEILKSHKEFLLSNLDKDESFVQNWLGEEKGKYRRRRCLIFGIEYVDPKREGEFMRKRFDILAEQNLDCHVLIELKSPNAEIFSIKKNPTINDGVTTEYSLSPELGRAIPQILGYRRWYENARPEEIQALGIDKKRISKCIIVVGTRQEDEVWKENFQSLKSSINIELYTYSDLIDRLDNTIKNLEQTL